MLADLDDVWIHETAGGLGVEREQRFDDRAIDRRHVVQNGANDLLGRELKKVHRVVRGHRRDDPRRVLGVLLDEVLEHADRERRHHVRERVRRVVEFHLLEHFRGFALVERFERVGGVGGLLRVHRRSEGRDVERVLQKFRDANVLGTVLDRVLDDRLGRRGPIEGVVGLVGAKGHWRDSVASG